MLRVRLVRGLTAVAVLAVVVAGLLDGGWGREPSAEPTVQRFLLAWQQHHYRAAAAYTTGRPADVATALADVLRQLDATALVLDMGGIVQHGDAAVAHFTASLDIGQEGHEWTYAGRFTLHRYGPDWKILWAPSVINPHLRPGDRLAVVTRVPPRAPVLDATGRPLQVPSPIYVLGVRPASLTRPAATAAAFARVTGLDAAQVLGQIEAAPPTGFLELLTLDPRSYARLRAALRTVPGLRVERLRERLFDSAAGDVVGTVGTEDAAVLRDEGEPYQPGTTVGLTGLEAAYQHVLAGTPTTEVVVDGPDGRQVAVLRRWPGTSGAPVHTTIDLQVQQAADRALDAVTGVSAQLVAVQPATGRILAVASRSAAGAPSPASDPLDERVPPGTTFTIVSAAALLRTGLSTDAPVPCPTMTDVGGWTFTSTAGDAVSDTASATPFSADFVDGCVTAFAGLSRRLTAAELQQTARGFGVGARWRLPVPAFTGTVPAASDDGQLAAETAGSLVRVSPLTMAVVAAAVESGLLRTPMLVTEPRDPSTQRQVPLTHQELTALRDLMRTAVTSGAAAADLPGAPVYGQAALVSVGSGRDRAWRSWFVGYRNDVAFAVLVSGRSPDVSASALAARFLEAIPPTR